MLSALKYFLTGFFLWGIGTLFLGGSGAFEAQSEMAELRVVELQSRRHRDGYTLYRPVFSLAKASTEVGTYVGNIWSRQLLHEAGDVVPGRFDPKSGEMRSEKMLKRNSWIGPIARYLGIFIAVQGVALLVGVQENRLPLPVRVGHSKRAWWRRFRY
ncbi:MAG: hypothetical protein ABJ327_16020 [Litoreibacter sp.]